MAGAPHLDPQASSATVFDSSSGKTVDLPSYRAFDAANHAIPSPSRWMASLLATLPNETFRVEIDVVSHDGELVNGYTRPCADGRAAGHRARRAIAEVGRWTSSRTSPDSFRHTCITDISASAGAETE